MICCADWDDSLHFVLAPASICATNQRLGKALSNKCFRVTVANLVYIIKISSDPYIFFCRVDVYYYLMVLSKEIAQLLSDQPMWLIYCMERILKTYHGSKMVIPLYITACRKKICSESTVVTKQCRVICAIYSLHTTSVINP